MANLTNEEVAALAEPPLGILSRLMTAISWVGHKVPKMVGEGLRDKTEKMRTAQCETNQKVPKGKEGKSLDAV